VRLFCNILCTNAHRPIYRQSSTCVFLEISGIFTALTIASSANFLGLGAAWGGMLIFDALVFGMTLYKSLTLPRLRGVNLLSVLFRDG